MSTPLSGTREPVLNTPVFTLDGSEFGQVKELHGGYFKVDVPMARDFWLSTAYISHCNLERVNLNLRRDQLEDHRLSAPGADAILSDAPKDAVISDAEALNQRERMERELETQNARIRAGLL